MTGRRVKLTGGPEKTVTWIWLDPETGDQLKVEFYDFSELAQRMFGNDIAYTITVHEPDKLFSTAKQDANTVIPWMARNFRATLTSSAGRKRTKLSFRLKEKAGHNYELS